MANTFRNDQYRPSKILAYIAIAFFAALLMVNVLYLFSSFILILFPDSQINLDDGSSIQIGFGLIGIGSLLEIPLRILTIVFFLIWEYRAFTNLSALRAQHLEFSPGWAVGWWFVPFANLVKPFQVIRELWNESDPEFDEDLGFLSGNGGGTPVIIGFWWGTFLISNIIYRISNTMVADTGQIMDAFPFVFLVAAFLQSVAAGLIIFIIYNITKRQEHRSIKIGQSQQFQPPPPPEFTPKIGE